MQRHLVGIGIALLLSACARQEIGAQMPSEHGMVAQTVAGTTITVEYYRPVARGRELFGHVVQWGRHWTPGANWATTIDVDHDVQLEGHALPKGKYSIWTIPQPDEWTVMIHRTARVFHMSEPGPDDELFRFTVKPAQGSPTEVLTWSFPIVNRDGTELHLQWGTTDIALHITLGGSDSTAVVREPGSG